MAARCRKNGDPLDDMASYFAYCEWSWRGESVRTANDPRLPHVSFRMLKCPWHTAWRENGLEDVGHFYCRCVDRAILRGFNPAFRLRMPSCLPPKSGGRLRLSLGKRGNTPALTERQKRIQERLQGTQVKDFLYHTAHLYRTLLDCARRQDPQAAALVEAEAGQAFAQRFGAEALEQVRQAAQGDFAAI